jgi:DNA-directed RNA polymerase subunit RPC12/RpoP
MSGDKNPNWRQGKTIAYCVDCGKRISKYHKRCKSCARKGENSALWKGGLPKCIDCGKVIARSSKNRPTTRCPECWYKLNHGENHINWQGGPKHCIDCGAELKGSNPGSSRERCKRCHFKHAVKEDHPRWKGGWPKCIDCGKELLSRSAVRCIACNQKHTVAENHPNWKGGIGNEPYPFEFDDELKEVIRERDNYTCQTCGILQKEHWRKLDIHHINYDKDDISPNNLISLCQSCHLTTNYDRDIWQRFFQSCMKG